MTGRSKGKKKRNSSVNDAANNGGGGAEKKRGKKKSSSKGAKGAKFQVDIFNDAAMENAYYLCHNVQDVLKSRGFVWPEAQKKKKKGKR